MNQEEGFVSIGEPFSKQVSKARGITSMRDILRYVQKAPDDIRWTIDRTEFDELIAVKKDSAPGPDGIPYGAYRCAGGVSVRNSSLMLTELFSEGGTVPEHFAGTRTVFISKASDIDGNGRFIRSPGTLRPLTLCNCDCKLLTCTTCTNEMHTSFAEMHLFQAHD